MVSTGRGEPPNYPEGGVENETYLLTNNIANYVSSVHYVENIGQAELPENVHVHRVKPLLHSGHKTFTLEFATSPLLALRVACVAKQVLTENSIDLIHFHETRGNLPVLFLSRFKDAPMVLSVHGPIPWTVEYKSGIETFVRSNTYRLFDIGAFKRVDHLIAVSQWISMNLLSLGLPADRVSVVYNPIDTSVFSPEKKTEEYGKILNDVGLEQASYYISVGSLVSRKRHIELIRAFGAYDGKKKLLIVGDGPELGKIRQLISKLDLGSRIRMFRHVSVDLLPFLYAGARAFVTCSLAEGFPAAVAEAMSSGLGIISPSTPWIKELVNSDNGFLFTPTKTEALIGAFDFFDDDRSARQLGFCSRRIAEENFSLSSCAVKTLEIYRSILDRPCSH